MPSTSPAQARTMAGLAHGWKPKSGSVAKIPVKVARDFNAADKGTGMIRPKPAPRRTVAHMGQGRQVISNRP